jgi:hexulose-6-phosphate isomerase
MSSDETLDSQSLFSRREWLQFGALLGASFAGAGCTAAAGAVAGAPAQAQQPSPLARSPRRYDMKKSINLWAFPYPQRMSLGECFELAKRAGFDAVEVNYGIEGELSPAASEADLHAIRDLAAKVGIAISGVCSFLFWPYPLSANDEATRRRALDLAKLMTQAAHHLGTSNLLVVPGAVYIPWIKHTRGTTLPGETGPVFVSALRDSEAVSYRDCDARARAAVRELLPLAEKLDVHLNIENIFFNGYLLSPPDMVELVDSFQSEHVHVHFDTGNIAPFQFPEHWIPILGKRIRNIHFKEYSKHGTDFSLESFRPLLDGTTDWPAVIAALDEVGYRGYLTFEYFHPFQHYPEALIHQAGDALDRMLGRPARA